MRYKTHPQRVLMPTGEYFTHGDNWIGQHVDCAIQVDSEGYMKKGRLATRKEIKEYCK